MRDCMDVFPSNGDNVILVPWLCVHNPRTRKPEGKLISCENYILK